MTNINYDFYDEKDVYSDGDIENKILDFIKKYPNDYEESLRKDTSWPVLYHLSDARKNIIRWYPFKKDCNILEVGAGMGAITDLLCSKAKKVTSIELSKRRATAIYERNKDKKNLEIVVGNFKNIILKDKYDYILLNGVLEYGALYMDSDNPYEDFINKLKENLKPDGKILIAIENKHGLKYWCGATEDHNGLIFDGINNYRGSCGAKTFSKKELEILSEKCKMYPNFYYVFPDYKFAQVIYTDKALEKNLQSDYLQYYCEKMNLFLLEKDLYREIYNEIPFFANSYFIELSNKKEKIEVEFVKYNYYRNKKYNLITYLKENKFYKENIYKDGLKHLEKIINISNECKEIEKVIKEDSKIYSNTVEGKSLFSEIVNKLLLNEYEQVEIEFDNLYNYLKQISGEKLTNKTNTIFDKYKIKLTKKQLEQYDYYKKGFIDITFPNIFINKNKYVIIDQEWYEENIPLEYIIYRNLESIPSYNQGIIDFKDKIRNKFNIDTELFKKLESAFIKEIKENNIFYETFEKYSLNGNFIPNLKELIQYKEFLEVDNKYKQNENKNLKNYINELSTQLEQSKNEYNKIINSKGWKILNKLRKIKNIFKIKK